MREIIDQEIFSEPIGAGVKSAASIDAGEIVDEAAQDRAVVEHESVDGNTFARDALDFFQSFLGGALADATEAQRPFAVKSSLPAISGRLAIGDNDHLLVGAGFFAEHFRRQVQTVLQVGEGIAHIPGCLWQIFGLELDGAGKKSNDAKII